MKKETIEEVQIAIDRTGSGIRVIGPYISAHTPIECVCGKCDYSWKARPSTLKRVKACPKCNNRVLKSLEEIQEILNSSEKDFTIVEQTGHYDIRVVCNKCSYEWVARRYTILRNGCGSCSNRITDSIERVQKKLDDNNRNIQVSGEYINTKSKIDCLCLVCQGTWRTKPYKLLNGKHGCPSCAKSGFDPNKPGYLYYLRVVGGVDTYWKIGITNLGVKGRFRASDRAKISVLYCHLFDKGQDAQSAEKNILDMFKEYKAKDVAVLSSGNTELFTKDVLQMNHLNWGPI